MNLYYKGEQISVSGDANSPLKDLKICAIGDSNTQYMGSALNDNIVALTGCHSVNNMGTAGATWETSEGDTTTSNGSCVGKVNQLIAPYLETKLATNYNVISIMMGTNCNTVGTFEDTGVETMCGAMHYCLKKLLYYYRTGTIVGIIPPQRLDEKNQTDKHKLIKQIYEYYSVPYLDLWECGQIVDAQKLDNNNPYYLGDGTHLGGNGQNQFYHKYARFLESQI